MTPSETFRGRGDVVALDGNKALVCAATATVVKDDRKLTPYKIDGDVVGQVTQPDADGFYLVGWSFVTRVLWGDVRGVWRREQAPDPCPICGGDDK